MFRRRAHSAVLLFCTLSAAAVSAQQTAPAQTQPAAPIPLQSPIPFDAAVKTGTLPNGLRYYVRRNARPANRVLLRLAVKTGSLDEADDQQGLAHMLEHMAFNGGAHFKPGELISYFESTGARLGPHVNAYTGFEETVYMLDLPSDKPEIVDRGLDAMSDFAGGLTLDPKEIDKERGVVIEEWRGGLGAASRVRDKEIPVLYYHSRYAERIPIGKPDIIRSFPPERLRAFYDMFYRPDRMALVLVGDADPDRMLEAIRAKFSPLKARDGNPVPRVDDVPLQKELLVSIVTDPELTESSVNIIRKRPREYERTAADYRRDLVRRFFEAMLNERFDELTRRPDARFLGAGFYGGNLSPKVDTVALGANVQSGGILDGMTAIGIEAKRARQFGFAASELDRAKKRMSAQYERAYNERDKTESSSYAQEYLDNFLEDEPSPGIDYEYRLLQQVLPGISAAEVSSLAKELFSDDSRVVLVNAPQKPDVKVPTEAEVRTAIQSVDSVAVTPWNDTSTNRELLETKPSPAAVTATKTIDDIGVTVVTFANGLQAWLKPTDFKNDQVLFSMYAKGGLSLAPPQDFPEASLASALVSLSGAAGLKALDLQKLLAGKLAGASPTISLSTQGFAGSAAPAELETALQLLYAKFTQPGNDPEAFELLKKQLNAAVVNRLDNPDAVFGDKVEEVNSSNHYTSKPLTVERVNTLDRQKMIDFYKQRFSNAADFTFFMVGAFKVDDAVPLLARYVGSLPSTHNTGASFSDMRIHFPSAVVKAEVDKGTEPKSQTVISFFADPPPDAQEQERVNAAADVLEISLRDILREDLGQTYTVSAGLSQSLPQRGDGHIEIVFGAAPENIDAMTARVFAEVKRLQTEGPNEDLLNRAKETARRNYETSLKQNAYWLGRLQAEHLFNQDPSSILHRSERIDALTRASIQDAFKTYFPAERYTVVTLRPAEAKK
ncbi:MAG TPA: insulinase family protein [Vicinamibacterales bacterium]|jgi:zinc protease|nr:insulinase family protein [Vicinamibacterales bacterium]